MVLWFLVFMVCRYWLLPEYSPGLDLLWDFDSRGGGELYRVEVAPTDYNTNLAKVGLVASLRLANDKRQVLMSIIYD